MSESSGRQAPPNNPAHGSMRDWIFGVDSRSAGTSSERWGSYGHAGSGNQFPLTPSHPTFHPPAALNDHGTLLGRRASAVHELRKPWSSAPIHGRRNLISQNHPASALPRLSKLRRARVDCARERTLCVWLVCAREAVSTNVQPCNRNAARPLKARSESRVFVRVSRRRRIATLRIFACSGALRERWGVHRVLWRAAQDGVCR